MAWTASASPRFLSDVRMTRALFKRMSTRRRSGQKKEAFPPEVEGESGAAEGRFRRLGSAVPLLEGSHPVVLGVVLEFGQVQGFEDGRDVHPESTPQAFLQPVPTTDRILRGSAPRFDGPVGGRLLFVRTSQQHPIAVRLEHRVQIVDRPEMVPEFRAPRFHDERRRIERFIPECRELRRPARGLEFPWMIARSVDGLSLACHLNPPVFLVPARLQVLACLRAGVIDEAPRWLYFNDSPPSGDGLPGADRSSAAVSRARESA